MSDLRLTDVESDSMVQISCCEAKSSADTGENPRNFENRKFITVSTVLFVCICVLNYCHRVTTQLELNIYHIICRHMSLNWARWIRSTILRSVSLRSILLLFSHVCWGLSNDLFVSDFPTKILHAFVFSFTFATCRCHHPSSDHINNICQRTRVIQLYIVHFSPFPSLILGPYIFRSILFTDNLSLCPSLVCETRLHTNIE